MSSAQQIQALEEPLLMHYRYAFFFILLVNITIKWNYIAVVSNLTSDRFFMGRILPKFH